MHGSNSFLNLRLTIQDHFSKQLAARSENMLVVYGKRDPAATKLIDTAPKWMQIQVFGNGGWLPRDPGLFQVTTFTKEVLDPYELELDRMGDLVKDIFDVPGGLVLKDYRVDRTNPPVVVDPIHSADPVKLSIRYYDFDDVPGPAGTNEMLNGKAHLFRVWYWRHNNSGV